MNKLLIDFKVIPHSRQRYQTCGDYFEKRGWWCFRVSKMKDKRYAVLVFLHEIIEFCLCRLAGIPMKAIDEFDITYENSRKTGHTWCGCKHYEEPGDDPHAPYHAQHMIAGECERTIADALDVDWDKYEAAVQSL